MDVHYQRDVRPKACVGEFLELVRGEGIRMCVATAVPRDIASRALEKHGLLKYFEFVTDVYETPCKKNDPRYFQYLSDRLGVRTERCCMFEDALYSIRCAKAAGMQVWAVEDGCAIADRGDIMNLADRYIKGYDLLLGRGNEEEGINYRNL